MAAAVILASTKRLEGSLVAPDDVKPVPNHLSDTKTYANLEKSAIVQAIPGIMYFKGYVTGQVYEQILRIVNISKDNQQMHILPPATTHFAIQYSKKHSSIVPGLSLDIVVQFRPTEWRYYYDTIGVHCKQDENVLVPIHAYPVVRTDQFPRNFSFPAVPIGEKRTKTFCLQSDIPVNFEFKLTFLQPHPAFTVKPLSGIVPGHGKAEVSVTYAPTEFNTAVMTLQVELSQFNSSLLVCTFTGNSSPDIAIEEPSRQQIRHIWPLGSKTKRTHTLPPLEENTQKEKSTNCNKIPHADKEFIYEGIHFPNNLDTPSVFGKVLAQRSGKMKASELRKVTSQDDQGAPNPQLKEAMFVKRVTQAASEESSSQLQRMAILGETSLAAQKRSAILKTRTDSMKAYDCGTHKFTASGEIYQRAQIACVHRRTEHRTGNLPSSVPKFDPCCNDAWVQRYCALERFVQVARKVLVGLRCGRRLMHLQGVVNGQCIDPQGECKSSHMEDCSAADFVGRKILPMTLLTSSTSEGAQGSGMYKPLEFKPFSFAVKRQAPTLNLEVPKQFELMGYTPLPIPSKYSYFPPGFQRSFRSGAQDELNALSSMPGVNSVFLEDSFNPGTTSNPCGNDEIISQTTEAEPVERNFPLLMPPPSHSKLQPLHPLHIFNPSPGSHQFMLMLPHSEASLEYNLLPLPSYPSANQKHLLDPQDTIPEVMRWKQFPAHILLAMEEKTLSPPQRPQQGDLFLGAPPAFSEEQFLTGPHPDDLIDDNGTELMAVPTLEMVRAQFYIPDCGTTGDAMSQAEELCEGKRLKKVNELGENIRKRLHAMELTMARTGSASTNVNNPRKHSE